MHGGGFLFAGFAAHFGADALRGDVPRRAVQPAAQHRVIRQLSGIFRQHDEHALRHVFGKMRIIQHPQRPGMHEIDVPANQLGECGLGAAVGVSAQQLRIGWSPSETESDGKRKSGMTLAGGIGFLYRAKGIDRCALGGRLNA